MHATAAFDPRRWRQLDKLLTGIIVGSDTDRAEQRARLELDADPIVPDHDPLYRGTDQIDGASRSQPLRRFPARSKNDADMIGGYKRR